MHNSLSLIILLTLTSCGIGEGMGPLNFSAKIEEPVRAEEVNFAVLKKRVLPKCLGCHKDWTSEDIVNRFTRESDPDHSRLYTTIVTEKESERMPKNAKPLSAIDQEIVRNYIQNIQWKTPEEEPLPDDGKPVSFETLNEKVFKISCLPCHGQRGLKDEASLTAKWIDKTNPEKSKLLLSVTSGKMPKERNLLTPNQIELIRRYLRNFR